MVTIDIAKEFSEVPTGRCVADGEFSGQRLRDDFLLPGLKGGEPVTVRIDGTAGYASSFLEEAFGGLVREGHFSANELHKRLSIRCDSPAFKPYEDVIWRFIDRATPSACARCIGPRMQESK